MRRQKRVLVVEDRLDDAPLMMEAFQAAPAWDAKLASDGEQALDIMGVNQREMHARGWRPDVVILNLVIPKICGYEVLETMKKIPELATIPVVIWTVSITPADIRRSYNLGAVAHMTKPVDVDGERQQARAIRKFFDQAQFLED